MKRYCIVALHSTGHQSLLNTALYLSKKEAEQAARWHEIKFESEKKLSEKFWGEPISSLKSELKIAELTI